MDLLQYCDKSADVGTPVRYDTCPFCNKKIKAKGFVVTRTTNGYIMYCHKCSNRRFVKSDGRAYVPPKTEVTKRVKNIITPPVSDRVRDYVMVPFDMVKDIPTEPLLWLRKYNVTDEEIETYQFGWSMVYERLVMPVYNAEGTLVYWQGRYFGDKPEQSKYLNIRSSKDDVYFTAGNTDATCIVVVEDIISAIAIARTGCRALALLGSSLPDHVVQYLIYEASLRENLQVIMWLDSDKRGASIEFSNRLNVFNLDCTWRSTSLDPKCYTPEDISKVLEGEDI